ncbi:class I SAM-dependent methyltransferase [Pseudomonas sp. 21LCFQ02]|uniref:class I SAM-dependent methyltransferase n=1 Tax=Pseudomonas sp. 21LCFQ02 TaxID=2957505 RepID=UPI00209AE49B|nr:class I SAM-dependent methyltransferase [Pseudomonas sp. 21LCFQ02]MCO8170986.1 class I SAM-dependent methyltransferase [Pseudomonas sp. 21LCFQ02]
MSSASYLTDVAYPHHFQTQATPNWLAFVATALGRAVPDISRAYRSCELGCGQGYGAVINAAANPNGHFVAVDINPRHIAHGRALAAAAGVANIEFIEANFRDFAESCTHDAFDFVISHGVYSWVSPAVQGEMRQAVAQLLKPGGLAYLGYMSQPGLFFLGPLQQLLRRHVQGATGSLEQRVSAALNLLQGMASARVGFFAEHPQASIYLQSLASRHVHYVAHELLNEHWSSINSGELIEQMSELACDFIGSATALENIDEVSVPGNVLALLNQLPGVAERELFKDLARNQSDRCDLFQKRGVAALTTGQHRQALWQQCVTRMPGAPLAGPIEFDTRIGPVQGPAGLFGPLLKALADYPQTFASLAGLPALGGQTGAISPALQMLAWAGHVHPLLPGELDVERCQALNRVISERALKGETYQWLAAPTLGSAVAASPLQMLLARVLLDYPQLRGKLLKQTVLASARQLDIHATEVGLDAELEAFERQVLPVWQQLGVV